MKRSFASRWLFVAGSALCMAGCGKPAGTGQPADPGGGPAPDPLKHMAMPNGTPDDKGKPDAPMPDPTCDGTLPLSGGVYAGSLVALPALQNIGDIAEHEGEGNTNEPPNDEVIRSAIEVQNAGTAPVKAIAFFFEQGEKCEPAGEGPRAVLCSGLILPGSAWHWDDENYPDVHSALVFSVPAAMADALCDKANRALVNNPEDGKFAFYDFLAFENDWASHPDQQGGPLAIEVTRQTAAEGVTNQNRTGSYSGITKLMQGDTQPGGGYAYYAALVYGHQTESSDGETGEPDITRDTYLQIQNTGQECTSVEITFKEVNSCLRGTIGSVTALAPGESVTVKVADITSTGFRGNAFIRSSQRLAIVVDTLTDDRFTAYDAIPAEARAGSLLAFCPTYYRETEGWNTVVQVQNLDGSHDAKVKVYFLDLSGNILTTRVNTICAEGSQTFELEHTDQQQQGDFDFGVSVGSVRIESQDYTDSHGVPVAAPKIHAVIEQFREREGDKSSVPSFAYSCSAAENVQGAHTIAIPSLPKAGPQREEDFALGVDCTNKVTCPFSINIYDQNGFIDSLTETLGNDVELVKGEDWDFLHDGFRGSGIVHTSDVGIVSFLDVSATRDATDVDGDDLGASEGILVVTVPACFNPAPWTP